MSRREALLCDAPHDLLRSVAMSLYGIQDWEPRLCRALAERDLDQIKGCTPEDVEVLLRGWLGKSGGMPTWVLTEVEVLLRDQIEELEGYAARMAALGSA